MEFFFQDEILEEENDTVHVITKTEKVVGEFIIMYRTVVHVWGELSEEKMTKP